MRALPVYVNGLPMTMEHAAELAWLSRKKLGTAPASFYAKNRPVLRLAHAVGTDSTSRPQPGRPPAASTRTKAALALAGDLGTAKRVAGRWVL